MFWYFENELEVKKRSNIYQESTQFFGTLFYSLLWLKTVKIELGKQILVNFFYKKLKDTSPYKENNWRIFILPKNEYVFFDFAYPVYRYTYITYYMK